MTEASPSNNGRKTARGRFAPGNRQGKGRPAGSRNNASLLLDKLMADDAETIVQSVVAAAKAGDMQAARLVMDRVCPPRKGRPVTFAMPVLDTAEDVVKALSGLLQNVASGDLTPDEAATVAGILETKRRAIETVEIERRLEALEQSGPLQARQARRA